MRKYKTEILLLIPLLLYLLGFTLLPIAHATFLAFTNYLNGDFPSLASFSYILGHFQFKEAVFNTLFITIVGLTFEFGFGLGLALL